MVLGTAFPSLAGIYEAPFSCSLGEGQNSHEAKRLPDQALHLGQVLHNQCSMILLRELAWYHDKNVKDHDDDDDACFSLIIWGVFGGLATGDVALEMSAQADTWLSGIHCLDGLMTSGQRT